MGDLSNGPLLKSSHQIEFLKKVGSFKVTTDLQSYILPYLSTDIFLDLQGVRGITVNYGAGNNQNYVKGGKCKL